MVVATVVVRVDDGSVGGAGGPVWYTSRPLALKTSSFALAGSIPTEFGKLINIKYLRLNDNKLSGTRSLLILPAVVVRVYHLL